MPSPKFARRLLLTLAPPVLVLGAAFLTWHALAERMPEPLAANVGPSGRANSHLSGSGLLSVFSFPPAVISLLCLALLLMARRNPPAQRFLVLTSFAVSGMHAALFAAVVAANLDVADAKSVTFGWWTFPLTLLVAALSGALGYALAGEVVIPKRITVDAKGLTVYSAPLRKRIALDEVKLARARSGTTLVVELDNGTEYVVTVDDADSAATQLNSLAERARTRD
ncbi:hypothetical protein [Allokutzneria albata]|uniref:Uncharacterized protein n=1 Tax=Allokutzneria albata TaxID=211114 RepID=A0A1H0C7E5_ALLAB|nr:hypothetical protein [Allokutzneria albata]SDN53820.1 hypothetical protein SAMN04489726_7068 [Allokutzneria albata]